MKRASAQARPAGTTKHCRDTRTPAITAFGGVVRQEIKSGRYEIDKLKLGNWTHTHQCCPAGSADNRSFRNRRINYASFAELIEQTICNLERSPIEANIFANNKDGWIALHFFPDTLPNSFDKRNQTTALRSC